MPESIPETTQRRPKRRPKRAQDVRSTPKRVRNAPGAFQERPESIPRCAQALPRCPKGSQTRVGIDLESKMVPPTSIFQACVGALLTFLCNASLAPCIDLLALWISRESPTCHCIVLCAFLKTPHAISFPRLMGEIFEGST